MIYEILGKTKPNSGESCKSKTFILCRSKRFFREIQTMKSLTLFFAFLLIHQVCSAQTAEKFQFGLHGNIGLPVGEFRETVSNSIGGTGWGAGMNFFLNPKKGGVYSPIYVGIEGNYMNLGRDKTPETTFLPQLKTTYNYFNVGPVFRLFLSDREEGFVPFLDGFVGMKVLNSRTQVDNSILDTALDQEYLESLLSTNYEGLGYGVGFGFYKRKIKEDSNNGAASFYLRVMYQYGDRINYVKRGSIDVDKDGAITYETGRTETSILSLQIGFLFF